MSKIKREIIEYFSDLVNEIDIQCEKKLKKLDEHKQNDERIELNEIRRRMVKEVKKIEGLNLEDLSIEWKIFCFFIPNHKFVIKPFVKENFLITFREEGFAFNNKIGYLIVLKHLEERSFIESFKFDFNHPKENETSFKNFEELNKFNLIVQMIKNKLELNSKEFIFDLSNIQDNKIIRLCAKSDNSLQNKKVNFEWLPKLINIDFLQHLEIGNTLDYEEDSFLGLSKQLISLTANLSGLKDIENFFIHLPLLRNLILNNCDFTKMEPYFFKSLDRLKSMIFFDSELHVIKKGMFHHLKSLKKLYIIISQLDELKKDCFDGLESLSFLEIWRSHKFDDLCLKLDRKAFKSCRNLEIVILSECGLVDSDMLSLEKLKNLKYLCLTGNYLSDLKFVNNLKNLEALDIFDNNFDQDIFDRFDEFSLTNLRFLRFDSQNIPKFGENYKNLQAIDGEVYSDVSADLKLRRLNGLQKLDYLKLNVKYNSDHSIDENEPVLFIKNLKYFFLLFYDKFKGDEMDLIFSRLFSSLFDLNPGDEEKYFRKGEARTEFAKVSLEEYFQEIIDVSWNVKEELVKAFVQNNYGRYNNLPYD